MWGTNANYNLGLGHQHQKNTPTLLENLVKRGSDSVIAVSHCVMQKFHTAVVTCDGRVFTFGHGHGGRLGHGSEVAPQLTPKQVVGLAGKQVLQAALGKTS